MSQITVTILDGNRAIHSQPHGSFVDVLVAALSADPETIEELEAALKRFVKPGTSEPLTGWYAGTCDEPYDAGICIVDLAARLVAAESTYSTLIPRGEVLYRDADRDLEAWLPYHVSDDWQFASEIDDWEGLAESRRRQRQSLPQLDARQVLYGQVCEFVVAECLAARGPASPGGGWAPPGGAWAPPEGWSLRTLPERAKPGEPVNSSDAVAEIHARWLMTPREDLLGRSPRDVLLDKSDHLVWDLQDRCQQWSMLGACPPPLSRESAAFRFGGFGTHEIVLYYELVRHLVWKCWKRVVEPAADAAPAASPTADVLSWLRQAQEQWLSEPDWEDLSGRTPAAVIRCERERIPMACSGKEAMVDDDCPLCQMLGESSQPMFWHLDGCNMDDDFPFSIYCRTRQEWEEKQREREEFNRKFDEEWKQKQAESQDALPGGDETGSPSIWTQSFSNPDANDESPFVRLFGIGCHVAELGSDLKKLPDTRALAESLNRQFGNLRSALEDPSASLLPAVVERFCQELGAAAEARADLAEKCADLERQLREFAASASGEEDDIPF